MKYKFFIFTFIILLLPIISAFTYTDGNLIAYWNFNNASSLVNATYYDLIPFTNSPNFTTGIIGNGSLIGSPELSNQFWKITTNTGEINLNHTNQNLTISFWINLTQNGSFSQVPFANRGGAGIYSYIYNSKIYFVGFNGSGGGEFQSVSALNGNVSNLITFTRNTTSACIYINGTLDECGKLSGDVRSSDATDYRLVIGVETDGSSGKMRNATIDEFGIWVNDLTQDNITELWNNGNGQTFELITTTLNNPQNNTNLLNPITFNCSASDLGFLINNITLYIDGISNFTYQNPTNDYLELTKTYSVGLGQHNYTCESNSFLNSLCTLSCISSFII